jgi:glutaconate CoA-transferase, subunit B
MSDDAATSMAVCLAREIHDGDVVGIGLGTPLALAAALMARRTTARGSHLFTGGMVVSPDADLLSITHGAGALRGRYTGYVSHLETMEMAERRTMTLQFLRPAQIDGAGNINTSRVIGSDGSLTRLPGGLASADVPRILPRLVLYHTEHRTRSLPQAVSFITGAGGGDPATGVAGPVRLITDRAVFSFAGGRARLESVHAGQSVPEVLACTGFECESDAVAQTEPPSPAELAALQAVDEHALRELELRATRGQAQARLAAALARLHSDPERERTIVVQPSTKPQETTCRR